ncbi:hypothetical protein [Candidatus Nitronereus thalassa]|uniref:DUF11 domain-containing protein n=1 Tax=Candidatus Nitronereus thalassa TaxID=3020898 RepID=A0ABU3K7D7_9BACT|nr:hypothetical protein [Candidatus Nitronereus thalassa]MDT7042279.1 hypothetical protein [Candidatus Nitronereus thalassa]
MNRGHWLGFCSVQNWLVCIIFIFLIQGCTGLQYGDHVSKFGRPLSEPTSPPASITIEPEQHTRPIKTQSTFTAIVKDAQGKPLNGAIVEWTLARAKGAVGDIIDIGQDPLKQALRVNNTYAIGGTNRQGESTITLTSVQEGSTHLIAIVSNLKEQRHHQAFAVMHWLDAEWDFPLDAAQKVGTTRNMAVTVMKASNGAPLEGYQVKWNVTSGPEAYFEESRQSEAIAETDAQGVARVTLAQQTPGPGENTVQITVVKPETPDRDCCPAVSGIIAKGLSKTTWMAPSITLEQQCPSALILGDTAEFPITLTNSSQVNASNVVLRHTIPAGMEFVGSNPQAQQVGNSLTWNLTDLAAQTSRQVILHMKAKASGTYVNEVVVEANDGVHSQSMCSATVGEPILSLTQTCPSTVLVGERSEFHVTITNTGTGVAKDLQLTDRVPNGMSHASGQPEVTRKIDSLAAGSTVTEVFTFTANQPGAASNVVQVTGSRNLQEQVSCDLTIEQPSMSLKMTGPENRFLGTTATYSLEVTNTGTAPTTGVVVHDTLPSGFTFESANPPGNHLPNTNNVSWNLGTMAPGETKTFQVTGRANTSGRQCNIATVQTERGLKERAEVCTSVEGVAALLLEVTDSPDPVEIGTQTSYSILVTNQGTANATNIKIAATIPDGMEYVSSSGSTARLVVLGKLVDFDPIPTLRPKENLVFTVTVKGVQPGDLRFRVEMNADQLTSPVLEEESTKLYQ